MIEISLKVLISERRRPRSLGAATCEKIGVGRSGFDFVSQSRTSRIRITVLIAFSR